MWAVLRGTTPLQKANWPRGHFSTRRHMLRGASRDTTGFLPNRPHPLPLLRGRSRPRRQSSVSSRAGKEGLDSLLSFGHRFNENLLVFLDLLP